MAWYKYINIWEDMNYVDVATCALTLELYDLHTWIHTGTWRRESVTNVLNGSLVGLCETDFEQAFKERIRTRTRVVWRHPSTVRKYGQ